MSSRKFEGTILTAYAERASGPGWGNTPIWVILQLPDSTLRLECLQPDEQTRDMFSLYNVSEAAHLAMTDAVTDMQRAANDATRKG